MCMANVAPPATAAPTVAPSIATVTVTVCYAPAARQVHVHTLHLPVGAKVRDALAQCAADSRFTEAVAQVVAAKLHCAVRGAKANADQALHQDDRLELCRDLRVDPKVARRERFAKQGARTTGLFAKRRPGAGAGY
jgi:uncharacterized protein